VDKRRRPELTLQRILELADAYHARTGDWFVLKLNLAHRFS
jgi:hypothetical protein